MIRILSIIIPVYNTEEKFLRKCLDSVVEQGSSSQIEAIIVDDGSINEIGRICDDYAEQFPIFKVIHIENQGVSNARNVGINEASGDYLMFLDSDDWLDENICSNLNEYLQTNTPDVLVFNYYKVIDGRVFTSHVDLGEYSFKINEIKELQLVILRYSKQFYGINLLTPWCKVYKSNLIRNNEIMFIKGLARAEDMLFNLNVLEYARDIRFYPVSGYFYRINALSESQMLTPKITKLSNQIRGYLEEFIKVREKEEVFYEGLNAYCIENIFEQLYMYYGNDKNKLKEFYKLIEKDPFKSVHKKVKLARLRYAKLQIYTIAARLHLRKLFLLAIYYKNKTKLRGRYFRY
ncbi:MAG: glycosyltransferase [Anaerolineaceae bacterium]|nr:MAG: glycosyltransferase [Anaerolineaceae bacterium]